MNNRALEYDPDLIRQIFAWSEARICHDPDPKSGGWRAGVTHPMLPESITRSGIGAEQALARFQEIIVPTTRVNEDAMNFAFVAASPSTTGLAFETAVAALNVFGGNWDNAAGAIQAENQALRWLADRAGYPKGAGGTFVAGGTSGNLSALVAAREHRLMTLGKRPERWILVCGSEAHSSITSAAKVMDADVITIPSDDCGRMRVELLESLIPDPNSVFALVGNAGATNCGAVDDFKALSAYARTHGIWLHIDGAYGLGALAASSAEALFPGLELSDSFIVDPHKWLFAPYDCCALIYRTPEYAAAAHAQRAVYLDAIKQNHWNPSDYAIHLSRRLRGLAFWFSLVVHGTDTYQHAIDATLETTREIARQITQDPKLELLIPPSLSVILFRNPGMTRPEMDAWSEAKMRAGEILCLPTLWRGEDVYRLCLVHPKTDADAVMRQLRTL